MRSVVVSDIVGNYSPNSAARIWATPPNGLAASGRQRNSFKVDFLENGYRYRRRSFAVGCPSRVSTKDPDHLGVGPPMGGQEPPTQISLFAILKKFVARDF